MSYKNIVYILILLLLAIPVHAIDIPTGNISTYSMSTAGATYDLTGNISTNATAISVGANNTTLDGHGYTIDCGWTDLGYGVSANGKQDFTIKNVSVITHNTSTSATGILVQNSINATLTNCRSTTITGTGVYLSGGTRHNLSDIYVLTTSGRGLYILSNYTNINNSSIISGSNYAVGVSANNNLTMKNVTGISTSNSGIYAQSATNLSLDTCRGYSNTTHGLYLLSNNYTTVINSIGYTNSTANGNGITVMDTHFSTVTNCYGSSQGKYGIWLNGNVTNNSFINCIGECRDSTAIYHGIWFNFSSATYGGTNNYTNITSISTLATTDTSQNEKWLCEGDSITAGGAAGLPYGAYTYYAKIILGEQYTVYNRGLGGETAAQGRTRFLDELAVFQPEYVSIMYGANDLTQNRTQQDIIDDILWMAQKAKDNNATPIILLTTCRSGVEANTTYLDQNLSTQATAAGFHTLNMYDIIDTIPHNGNYDGYNSSLYADSVHPNQAGNAILGETFADYIKPSAHFAVNSSTGSTPLSVQYTAPTKSATAFLWEFDDSTTSTEINPTHTYETEGEHITTLTVSNGFRSATASNTILAYIEEAVNTTETQINDHSEALLLSGTGLIGVAILVTSCLIIVSGVKTNKLQPLDIITVVMATLIILATLIIGAVILGTF